MISVGGVPSSVVSIQASKMADVHNSEVEQLRLVFSQAAFFIFPITREVDSRRVLVNIWLCRW